MIDDDPPLPLEGPVRSADALEAAQRRIEQLERAVEAHGLIGQAMGILMCQYRINAEAAFATLARVCQHHNIKLRDLAGAVVTGVTNPAAEVSRQYREAVAELVPNEEM